LSKETKIIKLLMMKEDKVIYIKDIPFNLNIIIIYLKDTLRLWDHLRVEWVGYEIK